MNFRKGLRFIGTQKALATVSDSVSPKRLTSGSMASSGEGQSGLKLLGSNAKGRNDQSATPQANGMDSTLQATTDLGGGVRVSEDE
jgi:hypothetical protein